MILTSWLILHSSDDTFSKAADVGAALASTFVKSLQNMVAGNDLIMGGGNFDGAGDVRSFIQNGSFLSFGGVDEVAAMNTMSAMLVSVAINALYRQQKVFIMGGGPCNDTGAIGTGPQNAKVCRDGQAWYLYFWQEDTHFTLDHHQWGWVTNPPGATQLGQGEYTGISVDVSDCLSPQADASQDVCLFFQDIINSSLDAYNVAEYNYTAAMVQERALETIKSGLANPAAEGPAWEGIFTVPVSPSLPLRRPWQALS